MNTRTHALLLGLLGLFLAACSQTPAEPPQLAPELRQSSVVSTKDPGFQPKPGETIAWRGPLSVHSPEGVELDPEILATLTNNLNVQFTQKGYQFAPAGSKPDYWVAGIVVLGNQLNESELRDMLGFEPGLVAKSQEYQKGSLLLLLSDPTTLTTDWRGVVQVFTKADLPEQVREQRLEYITHSLLRPLPNLTQPN